MSELSPDARDLIAQAKQQGSELLGPSAQERARLRERLTPLWAADVAQPPAPAGLRWKLTTVAVIAGLSLWGWLYVRPEHQALQPAPSLAALSAGTSQLEAALAGASSARVESLPPTAADVEGAGCVPGAASGSARGCLPRSASTSAQQAPRASAQSKQPTTPARRSEPRPERALASGNAGERDQRSAPALAARRAEPANGGFSAPGRWLDSKSDRVLSPASHGLASAPGRRQDAKSERAHSPANGGLASAPGSRLDSEADPALSSANSHELEGALDPVDESASPRDSRARDQPARARPERLPLTASDERTPARAVRTDEDPAPASIDGELELLGAAQAALQKQRPTRALSVLQEHAFRFPTGSLIEERMAMQALALCALQRRHAAQTVLSNLAARGSQSPLLPRVRRQCGL